ncbi:uncharacterized protein Dyak_GE27723 [Drosophila yakuba]|uniref:Uncharacterized protein n=1 Tax=Drosophila yakuba TaxID=7245 RepID=A0A0R1DSN5_DROYA|nr:uncharacterized protein Dyak_GE27723 [Drosophila yakuba]
MGSKSGAERRRIWEWKRTPKWKMLWSEDDAGALNGQIRNEKQKQMIFNCNNNSKSKSRSITTQTTHGGMETADIRRGPG